MIFYGQPLVFDRLKQGGVGASPDYTKIGHVVYTRIQDSEFRIQESGVRSQESES